MQSLAASVPPRHETGPDGREERWSWDGNAWRDLTARSHLHHLHVTRRRESCEGSKGSHRLDRLAWLSNGRGSACRCVASSMGRSRNSDCGRRRCSTRAPLCDLSPDLGGQSSRRACFDRSAWPDWRGIPWTCVLGHGDLHAAVLCSHRPSDGTGSSHVSLSHAGCGTRKAREYGYEGALYAWESADTGDETTPQARHPARWPGHNNPYGEREHHISADIAYAVWQYWRATGDNAFMLEAGAEILVETARFWASPGAGRSRWSRPYPASDRSRRISRNDRRQCVHKRDGGL